jgi:alpha-tubulin suppressor-like RCC1 family protein
VDSDDGGVSGAVRCWGGARLDQLGPPDMSAGASPSGVPAVNLGGLRAVAVSAGAYHTCALIQGGKLACWGWNDYQQLDLDSGGPLAGPVVAFDLGTAQAVAAGGFHTCAILAGGVVSCWGDGDAGQTGFRGADRGQKGTPPTSVDLGNNRTARSIAAGTSHTCALLDDFSVKCWGLNLDGELGIGDSKNRGDDELLGDALPRVNLGPDPVSMISAGANHTCAIQGADAKCWGSNESGRLGIAGSGNRGDDPSRPIIAATSGM